MMKPDLSVYGANALAIITAMGTNMIPRLPEVEVEVPVRIEVNLRRRRMEEPSSPRLHL